MYHTVVLHNDGLCVQDLLLHTKSTKWTRMTRYSKFILHPTGTLSVSIRFIWRTIGRRPSDRIESTAVLTLFLSRICDHVSNRS